MKNVLLTLIVLSFSAVSASALEPLILEPLGGYGYAPSYNSAYTNAKTGSGIADTAQQATAVNTAPKYPANMIPQNAAAEGKPVIKKAPKRINIETKQGSRTNTQWNPGGKGTKSYF